MRAQPQIFSRAIVSILDISRYRSLPFSVHARCRGSLEAERTLIARQLSRSGLTPALSWRHDLAPPTAVIRNHGSPVGFCSLRLSARIGRSAGDKPEWQASLQP
jgi:hypothetical protein